MIFFDEPQRTLRLAHDWRDGKLDPVHPSVGRLLNHALTVNDEDAVPFGRATNSKRPSLTELIRREYACAPSATSREKRAAARRFADQMSTSVHGGK